MRLFIVTLALALGLSSGSSAKSLREAISNDADLPLFCRSIKTGIEIRIFQMNATIHQMAKAIRENDTERMSISKEDAQNKEHTISEAETYVSLYNGLGCAEIDN
jgi:hypothetical protein